ncbi:MAG: hypothetical protein HGA33_05490 [Candidatus Moranbacteria bacterium]|nr:hypothetical protein [Candidatus Moranbacteria bacterium]
MDSQFTLDARLVGILYGIGMKIGNPYYFDQSSLFWSTNRLFSFYYRIVTVYNPKTSYTGDKEFLDADLESYIIRHRIILNDIGYAVWQLLELCNFKIGLSPKGNVHPKNKEVSFFDLAGKLQKNTDSKLDGVRAVIQNGVTKFGFLRDQRDNIAHYKSSVMIFGSGPDFEFAIMNPANTMPTIKTGNVTKLALKNVFHFTNEQHLSLWEWMNGELADTMLELAKASGISADDSSGTKLSGGAAISTFKEINRLS